MVPTKKKTLEYQIQREEKELSKNFIVEQDINQILDKINQEGFDSLTDEEQDRCIKEANLYLEEEKRLDCNLGIINFIL